MNLKPSIQDLTSILGFKKLKKITFNINKFQISYLSWSNWLQVNAIPNSVKEIEVINGHAILEEVLIQTFETAFPCLEKLVIDPFDYYGRKCGKKVFVIFIDLLPSL